MTTLQVTPLRVSGGPRATFIPVSAAAILASLLVYICLSARPVPVRRPFINRDIISLSSTPPTTLSITFPKSSFPFYSHLGKNLTLGEKLEFWRSIRPAFKCPPHLFRLVGAKFGQHYASCGIVLLRSVSPCVVYSFGVGGDSGFEADVVRSTSHCQVWAYDHTVDTIGFPLDKAPNPRVHFRKLGIGGKNITTPRGCDVYTLKTFMRMNGYEWIDILKIDVEGPEFPALDKLMQDYPPGDEGEDEGLPFGQLAMEVHMHRDQMRWNRSKGVEFLKRLEGRGLRLFDVELNRPADYDVAELAFVNVRKLHKIPGLEHALGNLSMS